jgi:hypothetical protein
VSVNTIAECLRTDCNILGDKNILDYIHIFEVVLLQVIMRPTDLTLEMGKLLAATRHHNPKFSETSAQSVLELSMYRNT